MSPIRPSERAKYPATWRAISTAVKQEQGWKCGGSERYPTCRARHGERHPETGSRVVLTTAHLDHDPANSTRENLVAMCQRCHLTYDAQHHARNAAATRRAAKRNGELFGAPEP